MSNEFDPWGGQGPRTRIIGNAGQPPRPTPGQPPRPPGYGYGGAVDPYELMAAKQRIAELEEKMTQLAAEARPCGLVVEIRERDMMLAFGPANTLAVEKIAGVQLADRVLCNRNTMQAIEIMMPRDPAPAGVVITIERKSDDGAYVEGTFLNMLRTYQAPPAMAIAKGDRVVLDPSNTIIIGNLGKPPAAFAMAPKVSVGWDDIGGHVDAKAQLREAIELPLSHPELFAGYGKRMIKGVLLWGPSGTGKTILAKACATAIAKAHGKVDGAAGFVYVKGPELLNAYIGKSEEAIRGLFKAARDHKALHGYPSVIFLDECDALLGIRDRGVNVSVNATTVPQFLAEMDGLDDPAAIFILATNRPDALDPAVLREGRVDRKVRVDRPKRDDARQIFEIHLRGRPLAKASGTLAEIAHAANEYLFSDAHNLAPESPPGVPAPPPMNLRDIANGAMIAEFVERSSTRAMLRDVELGKRKATGLAVADLTWAIDQTVETLRDLARGVM